MKKIHRFITTANLQEDTITLDDERIIFQLAAVLKIAPSESIILFNDGGPDVRCTIENITKHSISAKWRETIQNNATPKRSISAAVCIIKGDLFELVVQKLTEIGVERIIPLISERTVKQSVRLDRLQAISDEALELCGGNRRVTISEPMTVESCLEKYPEHVVVFERASEQSNDRLLDACMFYIGPEGGWSKQELERFRSRHATFISLGERTLRAETAAIIGSYLLTWNS